MATTIFNNLVLATARRLKDTRSTADSSSDSGKRYTSAILAEYLNRSIRSFLIEKIQQMGEKMFASVFPEYIKTASSPITVTSGVGAKPSDCFTILDLYQATTLLKFWKVSQNVIQDVISGIDKVMVPSATRPVFYEEGLNFKTLGLTPASVFPRYVQTHQDIAVAVSAAAGKYSTNVASAAYSAATKVLSGITMSAVFSANDVGRKIMIRDINGVFIATISAYNSATSVTIFGDSTPTSDDAPGEIYTILVTDNELAVDLTLNQYWHGEIIDRAVALALQDAKTFNQ